MDSANTFLEARGEVVELRGRHRPDAPLSETVPPHDLDAEKAVLGALLIDGGAYDAVRSVVKVDDFYRQAHRMVFAAAFAGHDAGTSVDLLTIREHLRDLDAIGGPAYLSSLLDGVPRSTNARHYAERVHRLALARRLVAAATRTVRRICDEPLAHLDEVVDELKAQLRSTSVTDSVCESLQDLLVSGAGVSMRPVLSELVMAGDIVLVHGQPRTLKTWFVEDAALAVSSGTPFGRFDAPNALGVCIVSNEDSRHVYASRFRALSAGRERIESVNLSLIVGQGLSLDEASGRRQLANALKAHDVKLLILDPLRSLTAGADQGPTEIRGVMLWLRELTQQTGAAVLIVHHDTKPQVGVSDTRRRAHRASGGGLFSHVDGCIAFEAVGEGETLCTPDGFKHRQSPAPFRLRLDVADDCARLAMSASTATSVGNDVLHRRIVAALRELGPVSGRSLARHLHARREDIQSSLAALSAAGTVTSASGPRNAVLWSLGS